MLPHNNNTLYTRPGALQVVEGDIDAAYEWDGRVVFQRGGRILLWTGLVEIDIAPAGTLLCVAAFQALTGSAVIQDRAYVADGVNPLWYISMDLGGGYTKKTIVNTILDISSNPYPIPTPICVESWCNRVWVSTGDNRVHYCDNELPEAWDPLFTRSFQANQPSSVRALKAYGDVLAVGTQHGIFGITGTSQFDWETHVLAPLGNVASVNGLASDRDANTLYFLADTGVCQVGQPKSLTEDDIDGAFQISDPQGAIMLSPNGRHLYIKQHANLFVLNTRTGYFGQITGPVNGIVTLNEQMGWYGSDGIWIQQALGQPDTRKNGDRPEVACSYGTWPVYPNAQGRSLFQRCFLTLKGQAGKFGTFTLYCDGKPLYTSQVELGSAAVEAFKFLDGSVLDEPEGVVRRELTPYKGGESFEPVFEAMGFMQVVNFTPDVRFGPREETP